MKNVRIASLGLMSLGLLLLAGCTKPVENQEDTNTRPLGKISAACTSYFDGCNTCMISGGVVGGCTRMYCAPENMQEPKCLATINDEQPADQPDIGQTQLASTGPAQKIDLTNCKAYFDGCNNCTVENGQPSACTLMYCENYQEPKCLDKVDASRDKDNDKINDCEKEGTCDDSVDYTVPKPEKK